jgi:hypothetical protein
MADYPWDRFDHLQHSYREFFMWELPSNSPTFPVVELDSPCVRLNNAQSDGLMTATYDFSFSPRQQSSATIW